MWARGTQRLRSNCCEELATGIDFASRRSVTNRILLTCLCFVLGGCPSADELDDDNPDVPSEVCDNTEDDDGDGALDCDDPDCSGDSACDGQAEGPWDMSLTTYHSFRGVRYEGDADVVAFADGDGDWQALIGSAGAYDFRVADPSGRYSVLVACAGRGGVRLHHGTAQEGTELHIEGCLSVDTSTFNELGFLGTVSGNDCMLASIGYSSLLHTCGASDFIAFSAPGPQDIIATSAAPTHQDVPSKLYVEHGINLVVPRQNHSIDFDGVNGVTATTFAVDNAQSPFPRTVEFFTRYTSRGMSVNPSTYVGVPLSIQNSEDTHRWCGGQCTYFKEPRDLTFNQPSTPTFEITADTPTTTPYARHRVTWTAASAEPIRGYRLSLVGDPFRNWVIHVSSDFLADRTEYELPDLSGIAGFDEPLYPSAVTTLSLVALLGDPFVEIANAHWLPVLARDGLTYWTGGGTVMVGN